jgi:hypothetical protein
LGAACPFSANIGDCRLAMEWSQSVWMSSILFVYASMISGDFEGSSELL